MSNLYLQNETESLHAGVFEARAAIRTVRQVHIHDCLAVPHEMDDLAFPA
jgi:hypothetical protein